MKVDGWICRGCRMLFENPRPGRDVSDSDGSIIEEQPKTCPFCGSPEIDYGYYKCEACGEDVLEDEMENDQYCHACAEMAWKSLDDYLNKDVQMHEFDKTVVKDLLRCM